jgi:predicted HTH transcriptional regulator
MLVSVWSVADVESALRLGSETRSVEVKSACLPKKNTGPMGRVVRAVLALSNIVDGGHIIIGVDNHAMETMTPGLTDEQSEAWTVDEQPHDLVSRYVDPPISLQFKGYQLRTGVNVAVIEVPGNAGEPRFCIKDLNDPADGGKLILRAGALYVRSIGKPESVEVRTRAAMEEIIDSAVTARLRAFVEQASKASLVLGAGPDSAIAATEADARWFDQQRRAGFG